MPDGDRTPGPGRPRRVPAPRGPLSPVRLELLVGRRSAAEGRRDECGPDRRAPPGLGQPPKGAATGDVAPTLLPPALRSPRAVPPRRHLHHHCRGVRGRPHRGTLHRGAPGYSPHFYEPKDLERQEWLRRTGVPNQLAGLSWDVVVNTVLLILVAVVWLTLVPTRASRRRSPPR